MKVPYNISRRRDMLHGVPHDALVQFERLVGVSALAKQTRLEFSGVAAHKCLCEAENWLSAARQHR